MLAPHSDALALHRQALERIAARYAGQPLLLKSDLRSSAAGSEGMQAPMIDAKGWHFASGPVVLASGDRAEISGVFNYAERGLFIELARSGQPDGGPLIDRPRLRVRIMIDVPSTDPGRQAAQVEAIIDRILNLSAP